MTDEDRLYFKIMKDVLSDPSFYTDKTVVNIASELFVTEEERQEYIAYHARSKSLENEVRRRIVDHKRNIDEQKGFL